VNGLRPTPRGIAAVVIAVVLFAAGLLLGNAVLRALGGFTAGVLLVSLVPALVRVRPTVERTVRPNRLQRGEHATARLVVRNEGASRQPGFTALDVVGGEAREVPVPALPPGEQSEHLYDVPATRRGRIDIGPLTVERADPLGLARSRTDTGRVEHVWVHPRRHVVRVVGGGRLRHHHEGVVPDHPLRGSTDVRALREYVPGDELRHVHWRASAKAGRLVIREYVDPVQPHCTVVLDNRASVLGADAFEEAVEVATSVLWSAVGEGHRVVLRTAQGDVLQGGDRPEAAQPLLDRLAAVEQADDADLLRTLDVTRQAGGGGWLVVVGGSADPALLGRLVGMGGFAPVTLFDVSGWPDAVATPGIMTVRGTTARDAVDAWNGLA
jgi:uncharacterized protein (DUF58 family)